MSNNSGGSYAKLSVDQEISLISHIEASLYLESTAIQNYVENTYDIKFSRSGMISWLHTHDFSYKKPNRVPAKADKSKQTEFMESYKNLKDTLGESDVILFGDGALFLYS